MQKTKLGGWICTLVMDDRLYGEDEAEQGKYYELYAKPAERIVQENYNALNFLYLGYRNQAGRNPADIHCVIRIRVEFV